MPSICTHCLLFTTQQIGGAKNDIERTKEDQSLISLRRYENILSNKVRQHHLCLVCMLDFFSSSNLFILFCHASFRYLLYPILGIWLCKLITWTVTLPYTSRANLLIWRWLYQLCSKVSLHHNSITLRVCSLTTTLNQKQTSIFVSKHYQ